MIRTALLALALTLLAAPAAAQDDPVASAQRMAEEGIMAYEAGDYPTAMSRFTAAFAYVPDDPVLLYFLAKTSEKLRQLPAAVAYYEGYLRTGETEHAEDARAAILRLRSEQAQPQPQPTAPPAAATTPPPETKPADAPREERSRALPLTATIIGGAAAIGALVSYLTFAGALDDIERANSAGDKAGYDDAASRASGAGTAFYVLFGLSAAGFGTAAFTW